MACERQELLNHQYDKLPELEYNRQHFRVQHNQTWRKLKLSSTGRDERVSHFLPEFSSKLSSIGYKKSLTANDLTQVANFLSGKSLIALIMGNRLLPMITAITNSNGSISVC